MNFPVDDAKDQEVSIKVTRNFQTQAADIQNVKSGNQLS